MASRRTATSKATVTKVSEALLEVCGSVRYWKMHPKLQLL